MIIVIKYIEKAVLGVQKNTEHIDFTMGLERKLLPKRSEQEIKKKNNCDFIIHAIYLQLWQAFFHCALHPNHRWNGLQNREKKKFKKYFPVPKEQSIFM